MNKLKYLLRRFSQNLRKAVVTALSTMMVIIIAVMFTVSLTDGPDLMSVAFVTLLFIAGLTLVFALLFTVLPAHRYDSDLIGKNFTGVSKKCRIFRSSVENIFARRVNMALNGFKELEENYTDNMEEGEKALVAFYTARCYDLMQYYPNASIYYSKAAGLGMKSDVLTMLTARCRGEMGDMKEAQSLYESLSPKSALRMFIRTDIGRLYLHRNDAENALKWYQDSINRHENYAEALGGAAIANVMLHNFDKAAEQYKAALLNHIPDPKSYAVYYKLTLEAAEKEASKLAGKTAD